MTKTDKPAKNTPKALPVFDNMDYLENPFRLKKFTLPSYLSDELQDNQGYVQDYEYAWKYLYSYIGSSATYTSYRREIERLLQWAWLIEGKSIAQLRREDIEAFIDFCKHPPRAWLGHKNVARFKDQNALRLVNPEWRPFVLSTSKITRNQHYQLSQAAIQAIFSILSSFYNFLIQEEVCESNPVALIRQKSRFIQKNQHKAPVRRISNLQWDYVVETAEILAADNPNQYERTLFIIKCLLAMYLRISELVADERSTPVMGDFRKDMDGNWWFHVTGKGNKNRIITVSDDMLGALKRYRTHLGLTSLPTPDDLTPLVSKTRGFGPVTSTRQVRLIVQELFDRAYQRMKDDNLEEEAGELKAATVHWLRHTGISEDVKIRPREHVRDDAGHASMQTTDRYIESDLRERHQSGRAKPIKPD